MKQDKFERRYFVELEYNDDSSFSFDVVLHSPARSQLAEIEMITRGTLMASLAKRAVAYNADGFDVASYIK